MKVLNRFFLVVLFFVTAFSPAPSWAQTKTQEVEAAPSPQDDEQKNVQAYIDLLRGDVRQEKAELMGAVMLLSAQDAAKFWPIYSEYDAQLTKLNNQRVQTIKDYAKNYDLMTDTKADELIQKSIAYQKQRAELLGQTYDKVKQALGAVTAARFAMIEHQLLLIIDLQIASSLPVVG